MKITKEESEKFAKQGWSVFNISSGEPVLQIQKIDNPEDFNFPITVLENDNQAIAKARRYFKIKTKYTPTAPLYNHGKQVKRKGIVISKHPVKEKKIITGFRNPQASH